MSDSDPTRTSREGALANVIPIFGDRGPIVESREPVGSQDLLGLFAEQIPGINVDEFPVGNEDEASALYREAARAFDREIGVLAAHFVAAELSSEGGGIDYGRVERLTRQFSTSMEQVIGQAFAVAVYFAEEELRRSGSIPDDARLPGMDDPTPLA